MSVDDRVVFLTGDLGFGVLDGIARDFPDRFVNAGVSEQNMLGMAAGLAHEGYRPCVYSIGNFATLRPLEQLRNDICYHRLPVTVISIGGGLGYGPLGVSHHASDDLGALLALPGLSVLAPSTQAEIDAVARWLPSHTGPVVLRIDRGAPVPVIPLREPAIGSATPIRAGSGVAIVGYGNLLVEAIEAAELLADEGIDASVDSLFSLMPFDGAHLAELAARLPLLVVEEHCRVGGLTTTIAQLLIEGGVQPVGFGSLNLGADFVREVGSTEYLRRVRGLDGVSIASAARSLLGGALA